MVLSIGHDRRQNPITSLVLVDLYLLVTFACVTRISMAGQLEVFSVSEKDGVYEARIVALLDAPARFVYNVITDYKHIYRINPSIIESEILPSDNGESIRVRNRFEHCIAFFCVEVEMVEDVVETGEGRLVATTIPELSSFTSGTAVWHVHPFENGRTRIHYRVNIEPDFFIPPVIGNLIMKSKLSKEITTSFARIECHARIMAMNEINDRQVLFAMRSQDNKDCTG